MSIFVCDLYVPFMT